MKVFSKEKFIKRMGEKAYRESAAWVDACDGMPVKNESCKGRNGVRYGISDTWCINVPGAVNCKCVVKTREGQKGEKKMYTMKDFKEKRIAVRVGTKHLREFLRMCDAEGLHWKSGQKAAAFTPFLFVDENTCVTLHCKHGGGNLMNGSRKGYEEQGLTIVDFTEIAAQATQPCYKIVIECDGTTTTARMEINGKEVKTAQAKRNPADKFDWRIGAETAFGRLFGKKGRPFKVGDRVVCVKDTVDHKKSVRGKRGIIRVIGVDVNFVGVEFDEDVRGHGLERCGVPCEFGHGWYLKASDLRHE